ncbi:hypothetical protein NVP2275O_192 [Vibrio phage 2.275.O._10N.286.54.E11]|nr:hypothetical protein NVP2275O_192 [Vibrio phage 2.275.O._10N.286.54.E11]
MTTITDRWGKKIEVEGSEPYTVDYTVDQVRQYAHVWARHNSAGAHFKDMMKFCEYYNEKRTAILWETGFEDWAFNFEFIKDSAVLYVTIHDWYTLLPDEHKVTLGLGGWE